MTRHRTIVLLVAAILLGVPAIAAGNPNPERGNYVPADLNTKIHPFVEDFRHGNEYRTGELLESTSEGWRVRVHGGTSPRTVQLPSSNVNLDPKQRSPGQPVVLKVIPEAGGSFLVTGLDRTNRYLYLLLGALAICLLVGGWITARALVGVLAGLALLFWVSLPLMAAGHNVLVQVGLFFGLVAGLVLPGSLGFNRRALSALATALSAGAVAGLVLYGFGHGMQLVGLRDETLRVLEFASRYYPETTADLSLFQVVVGGSLIGALGVILDVTVDVTSSTAEIARARPDLPWGEHLRRSLTVSSQLIGTMTNTLLLAYIGTDLLLILTVYLLPTPFWLLINKDFVAVELLRGMGGVLGFLSAAPLAIFFYRWFHDPDERTPDPPDPPSDAPG